MAHKVVWFDVPVTDLDRAVRFYGAVLEVEIRRERPDMPIAVLAHAEGDVAGCLFRAQDDRPSDHGPLLYFNVDGRLEEAVAAAIEHGGRVLQPPHAIGAFGHRAIVLDSEGNRIALHSE
ncbi:MAG TPA: VOC family protein [Candidatus Binatia bacterium]|nr:VOC family protein [Candidatus Binatia bacterium]